MSAKVTKKWSKDSTEIEIAVPAVCEDTETWFEGPTELLFRGTAPVKGHSVSFNGDAQDAMQIAVGADSGITLNGSSLATRPSRRPPASRLPPKMRSR